MPTGLIGRAHELRVVERLLDPAGGGGRALVLRGDPGAGKSALMLAAQAAAAQREMDVIAIAGVPSESRLPFAGLHQLLRPLRHAVEDLPARQRDALDAVFGVSAEQPPDFFLIALATLTLLADGAAGRPLLVLAEDAHWLDHSTSALLGFVGRRLDADPIALLVSTRSDPDGPLAEAALPELVLPGLDDAAAAELLEAHGRGLAPELRERVLHDAAGNPLALVELPAAVRRLPEAALPPRWLPLTVRLRQAFAARAAELGPLTQTLLLVAALDEGEELAAQLAAASLLAGEPVTVDALAPAVLAQLVELDAGLVRFRHPLTPAALHATAGPSRRQAAHRALAEALRERPDRCRWHRAAATLGQDEQLAGELEDAAMRGQRFGDIAVAVAALERAAELSERPQTRGRRLLLAAESAFEMGRNDVAARLIAEAETLALDPLQRARAAWLRELFVVGIWTDAANVRAYVELFERMRLDGDVELAARSLFTVALRSWWANPDEQTRRLVLDAADRLPLPPESPLLLATIALVAPVERGAVVLQRVAPAEDDATGGPEALRLLGLALSVVGAVDEALPYFSLSADGLRAQGRRGLLAQTLISLSLASLLRGTLPTALASARECGRLAQETGQPRLAAVAQLVEAMIAGLCGDPQRAAAAAAEVERLAIPLGASPILAFAQLTRGSAALADGRPGEAFHHLRRVFDTGDAAHHPFLAHAAVVDLAEAAAGCGRQREAREILAPLQALSAATPSPLLRIGIAFATPLLAEENEAEQLFEEALEVDLTRWPFVRGRLLLAHGQWLRRRRRAAESRAPLRTARDAFDALDARPWADRARHELRAAGDASGVAAIDAHALLSAQELQVAQMAAEGLTNREIGERLFVSHRTVSAHLYRAFPKLGVSSRAQLRDALEG